MGGVGRCDVGRSASLIEWLVYFWREVSIGCWWACLTGMEGAAGPLRRVKDAAHICGAGSSWCWRRSQGGPGGVWRRDCPTLRFTIRYAAIANLPGLILQRCWVSHGAGPCWGWADPWTLQRTGVSLGLDQDWDRFRFSRILLQITLPWLHLQIGAGIECFEVQSLKTYWTDNQQSPSLTGPPSGSGSPRISAPQTKQTISLEKVVSTGRK